MQARKSIRRDVKIVNSILADSAKYCHFVSGKVFDASRQFLSLNKAFYNESPIVAFKPEDGYYENWTWKDWISYITNPLMTIRISDFSKITNAKSLSIQKRNKKIVINVDKTDISRSFIFFLDYLANVSDASKVYVTKDFYYFHKDKFDDKTLIFNDLVYHF